MPKGVESQAESLRVTVHKHRIIYELLDDVTATMTKLLPPTTTQVQAGTAEVLQVRHIFAKHSSSSMGQVFDMTGKKKNVIAGCRVTGGSISRKGLFKVMRKGKQVHQGDGIIQ